MLKEKKRLQEKRNKFENKFTELCFIRDEEDQQLQKKHYKNYRIKEFIEKSKRKNDKLNKTYKDASTQTD